MTAKDSTTNIKQYQTISKLFTVKEASEYLQVHQETLRGYITDGELVAIDINNAKSPNGRTYRITLDAINEFLSARILRRVK